MNDAADRPKLITGAFLLLVAGHFLQGLGYASMLLLPLYLQHLGANRTEIGAVMAMAAIGSIVARPVIAWSLDTIGRKRTLVFGTGVMVLPMLGLYLVTEISPLVFVLRAIMGAGVGALWTGYFTFASDLIPPSRRTEGLALFGISGLLPLVVNPFAGALGIAPPELRTFFPIIGLCTLLSLVPLLILKDAPRVSRVERFRFGAVLNAMREKNLFSAWVAITALGAIVAVFQSFSTVVAENRAVERPGAIWLFYAFGATFVRATGGRLPDRIGPARLITPAFLSYAIAAIIAANGSSFAAFCTAGLFAGVGHGIGFPVITSQVVSRTPEHLRGSSLATLTALWEIASLAFTPLFGAIADAHGDKTMFYAAAGMIASSLLIWWPLERHAR